MHFCMTAQYTPKSLNAILENPKTNRQEAAKKLVEAAGGKLISMYSTAANGPRRSLNLRCARSQLGIGDVRHCDRVRRRPQCDPYSPVDAG
jgi:hypothetical protein